MFQGCFRAVAVESEDQLKNVFVYIHTNPAEMVAPRWKEGVVENIGAVKRHLENYKWSSYLDYLGQKNFPSVANREFFLDILGGAKGCRDFVDSWVDYKSAGDMEFLEGLTLDMN